MSAKALRDIIVKFGPTGQLDVLEERGRNKVNNGVVKEAATAVVEANSMYFH